MGSAAPRAGSDDGGAEIWGWCPTCLRWYFCDGWLDRNAPHPHCPVCLTEPTAIENRGATAPATAPRAPVKAVEDGAAATPPGSTSPGYSTPGYL